MTTCWLFLMVLVVLAELVGEVDNTFRLANADCPYLLRYELRLSLPEPLTFSSNALSSTCISPRGAWTPQLPPRSLAHNPLERHWTRSMKVRSEINGWRKCDSWIARFGEIVGGDHHLGDPNQNLWSAARIHRDF
jgi:hypothetical protein